MTNTALGILAVAIWAVAYTWYFAGDLRRWYRGRERRRRQRAAELAQARAAYAAWVRNIPPPRDRRPIFPPPAPLPPRPVPTPVAREGVVIPFPRRARRRN